MKKQDQILVGLKRDRDNSNSKRTTDQAATLPSSGSCIVLSSVRLGAGCVCDIELLSNGKASGLRARGAICRGQVLAAGDRCAFSRSGNQPIQLFAGGTSSISNVTATVGSGQTIYGGWITSETI